jgi:thiol-disulfide isomerase/thioredoxin
MMHRLSLLLLVLIAGCNKAAPIAPPPSNSAAGVAATETLPRNAAGDSAAVPTGDVKLSIVTFEGIQERIARERGKVVVMDAWSTSCPPCMKEFHHLVELHKKHGPEQLACISLSFDFEGLDTPEQVQGPVLAFLRAQGATFENLMSSEESDELYRKFKLAAVPAVFVYDRAGSLRKRFDNEQAKSKDDAFTYVQVEQLVTELLKEAPPN